MITYVSSFGGLAFTLLIGITLKHKDAVTWSDRFLFWVSWLGFLALPSGTVHELLTNADLDGGAAFLLRMVAGLGFLAALILFCARVTREEARFDSKLANRIPSSAVPDSDKWKPINYLRAETL